MTPGRGAVLFAALLVAPGWAAAQGLGDAAARERAKRAKQADGPKAAEPKVFTNEDLGSGVPGEAPATGASAPSAASAPPSASPAPETPTRDESPPEELSPEEERRARERPLLDAVQAARNRVSQVEARIRELQARLNPMSTTYIYGDFNVGGDKVAEETQVKEELNQAEADLTAARQELAAASQAHQDFRQGRVAAPSEPQ